MLFWYAAGFVAAIMVAWLAALLHIAGRAPIGIVSLGVGIALGAILTGIAASQRLADRKRLVAGTILLAFVTVLAQHAWLYRDFRRQWNEARTNSPQVAIFRPEDPWSPRQYFTHELTPHRAALWCLDATMIIAAAIGTLVLLIRPRPLTPDP